MRPGPPDRPGQGVLRDAGGPEPALELSGSHAGNIAHGAPFVNRAIEDFWNSCLASERKENRGVGRRGWSARPDSNGRPPAPRAGALPLRHTPIRLGWKQIGPAGVAALPGLSVPAYC